MQQWDDRYRVILTGVTQFHTWDVYESTIMIASAEYYARMRWLERLRERGTTGVKLNDSVAGSGQVQSFDLKDNDWWPDHDLTGHKNDNLTDCSVITWLDLTPVQSSVMTSHWLICSYNQFLTGHWLEISYNWSWTGQMVYNWSNFFIKWVTM